MSRLHPGHVTPIDCKGFKKCETASKTWRRGRGRGEGKRREGGEEEGGVPEWGKGGGVENLEGRTCDAKGEAIVSRVRTPHVHRAVVDGMHTATVVWLSEL